MPELFRQSGLDDVHAETGVEMYPTGDSRRTIRLDLVRSIGSHVLEMGVTTFSC